VRTFARRYTRRIKGGLYADPKVDALKAIMAPLSGRKVLIFTQSADTAMWLDNVMRNAGHKSYGVITGHTEDETRQDLIERFSPRSNNRQDLVNAPNELSILIATDTLAEAVNLQDCSNIVNFDLPWNPMILVQRVGRVDRIGNIAPTHVHNIMPSGSLENFLNLINKLEIKIGSVIDTVGKEFQILSRSEMINPKRFEQQIRKHPSYTGNVGDAVSAVETRGRVIDDMALPARELLARHRLEMLREAPSESVCAALCMPAGQHTVAAMYRIYDKTTDTPLSNIVVSMTVDDVGTVSNPEMSREDSRIWMSLFDFMGHGSSTRLAPPSIKSRNLLNKISKWFAGDPFNDQRLRYSRQGRRLSRAEYTLTSRIHDDVETLHVLESANFENILKIVTGIDRSDPLCRWIEERTAEERRQISKEVARRMEKMPGFVRTRSSGDIGHRLICWCAWEPR